MEEAFENGGIKVWQYFWHFSNDSKILILWSIYTFCPKQTEQGDYFQWFLSSQLTFPWRAINIRIIVDVSSWLISICYILPFCDWKQIKPQSIILIFVFYIPKYQIWVFKFHHPHWHIFLNQVIHQDSVWTLQ